MDFYSTRPIEEVSKLTYKGIKSNKEIVVSPHALDHLSEGQRKVFKGEDLKYMVAKETPRKVFLQDNGRYAVFFRKADGYRKLILEVKEKIITIVSFWDMLEIPKYVLKNGK